MENRRQKVIYNQYIKPVCCDPSSGGYLVELIRMSCFRPTYLGWTCAMTVNICVRSAEPLDLAMEQLYLFFF